MRMGPTIYDRSCSAFTVALVLCGVIFHGAEKSWAQDRQGRTNSTVRFVVNGEELIDRPAGLSSDPDSLEASTSKILSHLRLRGYLFARMDSLQTGVDGFVAHASSGKRVLVRHLYINGHDSDEDAEKGSEEEVEEEPDIPGVFRMRDGDPLDLIQLQEDIVRVLDQLSEDGRHMAVVGIDSLVQTGADPYAYNVYLGINRGPRIPISGLVLPGARRTQIAFAAREAGVRLGTVITPSGMSSFSSRLRETGNFVSVGEPELHVYVDSTAVLRIPVEEAPPGTFDFVLGYLPPGPSGGGAQIVGSGHLNLKNPFGYGRTFALRLDRRPDQASSVDVRLADPQAAGLPIRFEASFSGYQQDSTYNKRRWAVDLGYRLPAGLELAARYSRELTRPGAAGLRLRGNEQRISRSDGTFWGLVARLRRLDNPLNPRSGVFVESLIERGDKVERTKLVDAQGDTTRISRSVRQERLRMSVRGYLPMFSGQTAVGGADVLVLLSDIVDESDLFRFGGANSLRGYDEDIFRAATAIRLLVEYRILLDALSYAFVFVDVGYVETPRIGDLPSSENWYPGFGLGMQFQTAVGLVNATYALNDKDGVSNGRVHLGVSFGL